MRELSARLRTFDNPMFRANTRLEATNLTLAEAGMYYAGTKLNSCSVIMQIGKRVDD